MQATLATPLGARIQTIAIYFSGNLAATILTVEGSVLDARWTDPYHMGLWNLAQLAATYLSACQLGVFNGLNRQLPYYIGRGETERSVRVSQVSAAWCIFLTAASLALVAVIAAYY